MKRILLALFCLPAFYATAQMSGTYNVPSNFATIAAAISSLNSVGVSGPVTIQVSSGHTETVTAGGYSLYAVVGASSTNSVVFQKAGSGANPLLTAYAGTATPASTTQDGVWRLIGADYITIDGIDITDPNTSNPATMEFGYGLFKASAADGCQNNIIKNCVITLNRVNSVAGSGPSIEGSKGISMINATTDANTTAITTTAAAGANSNNLFYSNTIQNCNVGIALIGFADVAPFTYADANNDVGGSSSATGNTIINFGGGGTLTAGGISTLAQYSINVSYNAINSNTGAGVNHVGILRGIYLNTAISAGATVLSNTVTLKAGGTTQVVAAIHNISGATAASNTINISNNLIANCSYTTATSGDFSGILSTASASALIISGNTFSNNVTKSTSGFHYSINNTGAVTGAITIANNRITNIAHHPTTGVLRGISNTSGASSSTVTISNNTLMPVTSTVTGTGIHSFIYNSASSAQNIISANTASNVTFFTSGTGYLIYNSNSTQINNITGNYISGTLSKSAGGTFYCYYNFGSPGGGTATISGNNFSNITMTGATTFYGFYIGTSTSQTEIISNNIVSNVSGGSTSALYGIYHSYGAAGSAVSNNTVSAIYGAGAIYGITHGNVAAVQINVDNNTVNTFSTTGASPVYGIQQLGGTTANVFRNSIYNLSGNNAGTIVSGIYVAGGSNTRIYNNLVGDLRTSAATSTNAITGISLNGGTSIGLYFNSVHLNATSSGSVFGTSAVFTSTAPVVDLRNNIFVNLSTPTGTGLTVAHRRSHTSLANYSVSSNYNSYYAGTPGASNLLYYDHTNAYQTLSAYQAAVAPREVNSITENTPFLSLLGTSANFLHIDPTVPSLSESGAVNIAGITDDYDGQIRHGNPSYTVTGTAPDIGADEFSQVLPVCSGVNAATISAISFTSCAGHTLSLYSSGYSTGSGITHEWKISTTPGGPYVTAPGGVPNHHAFASTSQSAGVFYFVMVSTCSVGPVSATSNEISYTVVVSPTASISAPFFLCAGTTLSLTGSTDIGTSFSWSGPASFSSTNQNTVVAGVTSAASGVYSFVTTFGQCSSPVITRSITVNTVTVSVQNSNSELCFGNSSTLTANSSTGNYWWSTSATSNSIVVSPSSTTVYTVSTADSYSCTAEATTTVSVTNPTISGVSANTCPNTTATLSVNAFTPSTVNWYTTQTSTTSVGTGSTYTLNASSTTTMYAQATGISTGSLFTTLAAGNSASGNMFNIVPSSNIVVTGVAMHFGTANVTTTVEVWYRTGSFVGFETSNAGWTIAHSTTVLTNGSGVLTPIPGTFAINVPVGQTYALYVTTTNGSPSTNYTNGTTLGALYASNSDLSFYEGKGGGYFSVTNSPRIFNGVIYYKKPACVSPMSAVVLTVTPNPVLAVSASPASICAGSTATLGASGASTYTWSLNSLNTASITDSPGVTTVYTVTGSNSIGCSTTETIAVGVTPMPTISVVSTASAICAGESATLTASGAATYTWNNQANTSSIVVSPSVSTIYTVITLLQPCPVVSETISIVSNPLPLVTAVANKTAVCAGDTTSLMASGAATYSWSTGSLTAGTTVSPLANSVYTVVGFSAQGCTANATVAVVSNSLPVISIAQSAASVCAGSAVSFTSSGAATYSWNTGPTTATISASPSITTVYTSTGTLPTGCSATAAATVSVIQIPAVIVSPVSATICTGESVTLTASGAGNYVWTPAAGLSQTVGPVATASPSAITVYSVSGSVSGCSNMTTVTVFVAPYPSIFPVFTNTTVCAEHPLTLTASGAQSYTWEPGTVTSPTLQVSPLTTTNYTVTGSNGTKCVATKVLTVNVDPCTGIQTAVPAEALMTLYPNPTNGKVKAVLPFEGRKQLVVTNATGALILFETTEASEHSFDLSSYAKGIYFVRLSSEKGAATYKLIVQ